MVLVSHDRSLLTAVCDQLYLIHGGALSEFESDLDDYSNQLLAKTPSSDAGSSKIMASRKQRRREEADERNRQAALKKPLVDKLKSLEMQLNRSQIETDRIEETLAQSYLYEEGAKDELIGYLHEQALASKDKMRIEEEWLTISSKLEALKDVSAS